VPFLHSLINNNCRRRSCEQKRPSKSLSRDEQPLSFKSTEEDGGGIAVAKDTVEVELRINQPFEEFTDNDQEQLLIAMKAILHLSGEIKVLGKRRGSVILRLKVDSEDAERLLDAVKMQRLIDLGVTHAEIAGDSDAILPGSNSMFAILPGCELQVKRGPDWLIVKIQSLDGCEENSPLAEIIWALMQQHLAHRLVLELDQIPVLNSFMIEQMILLYRKIYEHDGVMRLCGLSAYNRRVLHSLENRFEVCRSSIDAVKGNIMQKPC
jgi:anti-anti-sigma regulatory factor